MSLSKDVGSYARAHAGCGWRTLKWTSRAESSGEYIWNPGLRESPRETSTVHKDSNWPAGWPSLYLPIAILYIYIRSISLPLSFSLFCPPLSLSVSLLLLLLGFCLSPPLSLSLSLSLPLPLYLHIWKDTLCSRDSGLKLEDSPLTPNWFLEK